MNGANPVVDAVLEDLVASIQTVLGSDLVAIYLYGSYVSGGFDPGISDLDLVAVTSAEIDSLDLAGLEQMHRDFVGRHPDWTDRIEVVYIGRTTLQSFRTSPGPLAVVSPGEPFHLREERVAEWVQNWFLVRETGVPLHGSPAAEIVPEVEWTEFLAAAERYAAQISDRSLRDASPGSVAYGVLSVCRAFMTVQTQRQCSKQEGAAWVRQALPEWAWLVDAALACRLARGAVGFADERSRAAAHEFIELLASEIKRPHV